MNSMGVQNKIMDQVGSISKKCEMLSNPLRILIISTILAEGKITWTSLKTNIEKLIDSRINPNTLAFHLSKLVEADYLQKIGTVEQPIYEICEKQSPAINLHINQLLVDEIKKEVSK